MKFAKELEKEAVPGKYQHSNVFLQGLRLTFNP